MKRKKLLTLLATSSLLISGAAIFAATSAAGLGTLDTRASEVQGSIVFSRATGDAYKIDDYTFSVSGKTSLGTTYYAVSHNNSDAYDTDLVAKFGGMDPSTDVQYVHFSDNKEGTGNFEFQGITGIKVTTKSSTAQTVYAYWSTTGGDWDWNSGNYNSVSASSNPEKVTFSSSRKFLALKGYSSYAREITSIELFYECSTGGDPGEKTVESIAPDWIAGVKQNYVLGDEFVPAPIKVTYSDSSSETITEGASFDGFNMSETGKQTVTVLYGGKETTYPITVRPSATAKDLTYVGYSMIDYEYHPTSDFLKSESVLPAYAEPGEKVYLTTVFKDAFMFQGFYEEGGTTIYTDGDTSWFIMPNRNIEWQIAYKANPNRPISYVGVLGYDLVDISTFLDNAGALPTQAEPASSVNFSLTAKEGFAISAVEFDESLITPVDGVYTFTMPSLSAEIYIYAYEVPVLQSMYVKSPKTQYKVGSSFVMPKVIGVYNLGEEELEVTLDNFSGFDSSAAVESQTITVSYPGVEDVTYTISIVDHEVHTLYGTFKYSARLNAGDNEFRLTFNDDGTGTFERDFTPDSTHVKESYGLNFVFDDSTGTAFSITLTSYFEGTPHADANDIRTSFFTRYPFIFVNSETTNETGVILSDTQVKIKLTSATSTSAGSYYTFSR